MCTYHSDESPSVFENANLADMYIASIIHLHVSMLTIRKYIDAHVEVLWICSYYECSCVMLTSVVEVT